MKKKYKIFVIDLDGVVYHGNELLKYADVAIQKLRNNGKIPLFLTNNSAKSSHHLAQKLLSIGIECNASEIMTSGKGAAEFIKSTVIDGNKGTFICGTKDLQSELYNLGLKLASPDTCGAVLVGQNPKFTYDDLKHTTWALQRNVPFIVCNMDPNFPTSNGRIMPGCGSIVSAVATASGRTVDIEIGKPNPRILELLLSNHSLEKNDCIIIGDSDYSDIELARRSQLPSVLIKQNPSQKKTDTYFEAESLIKAVEMLL